MNILQLISSTGFFGAENVVVQLAAALSTLGHRLTVGVLTASGASPWPAGKGCGIFPLVSFRARGKFDPGAIFAVRRFLCENHIAVVHSHNYKSDFYGYFACRGMGIRKVATCHNWLSHGRKMRIYKRMDKLVLRKFDAVVPVSRALRDELVASGIPAGKVKVIANGIRIAAPAGESREKIRGMLGLPARARVAVCVGRLSREKGHSILFQAFSLVARSCPEAFLLLVGDGPERRRLDSEARGWGIDGRVIFAGFRDDVVDILRACDLFVLPSLTEGMPMALLEAMVCRLACVATGVGEVPELLGRDECGLVVPPGDHQALAQALLRALSDSSLALALAARAGERAGNNFSALKMAEEYSEVYGGG